VAESEKEAGSSRPSCGRVFLKGRVLAVPGPGAQLVFWSFAVGGTAFDLWSKWAVFRWLREVEGGSVSLIDGFLRFVMALNNGAAFNIAAGRSSLLIMVSFIALAVILGLFFFSGSKQKLVHIAMAFFTAGICGNLYDRIFNDGLVRDFIDVYWRGHHWPAFNVADSMLCVGVGLLLISSFLGSKKSS
jgi:signal peptidase II